MRKWIFAALIAITPYSLTAMTSPASPHKPVLDIPSQFVTTGETKTLEWGCPINNELVEAENRKSATDHLISECIEQASRAARSKPEVAAVLRASVIAPGLAFREQRKGLHMVNGTIFLETIVAVARH